MTGYDSIYPIESNVKAMIKLTDDSLTSDLINVSMKNADNTINSLLDGAGLPTYTNEDGEIPVVLITAGNYFTVSDIHQALNGTDDRAGNEKAYYEKALILVEKFIENQLDLLPTVELKNSKSPYKSSKSPSARQLGLR